MEHQPADGQALGPNNGVGSNMAATRCIELEAQLRRPAPLVDPGQRLPFRKSTIEAVARSWLSRLSIKDKAENSSSTAHKNLPPSPKTPPTYPDSTSQFSLYMLPISGEKPKQHNSEPHPVPTNPAQPNAPLQQPQRARMENSRARPPPAARPFRVSALGSPIRVAPGESDSFDSDDEKKFVNRSKIEEARAARKARIYGAPPPRCALPSSRPRDSDRVAVAVASGALTTNVSLEIFDSSSGHNIPQAFAGAQMHPPMAPAFGGRPLMPTQLNGNSISGQFYSAAAQGQSGIHGFAQGQSGNQGFVQDPFGNQGFAQGPHSNQGFAQGPHGHQDLCQGLPGIQSLGLLNPILIADQHYGTGAQGRSGIPDFAYGPHGNQGFGQDPFSNQGFGQELSAIPTFAQGPSGIHGFVQSQPGNQDFAHGPHGSQGFGQDLFGNQDFPQGPSGNQAFAQDLSAISAFSQGPSVIPAFAQGPSGDHGFAQVPSVIPAFVRHAANFAPARHPMADLFRDSFLDLDETPPLPQDLDTPSTIYRQEEDTYVDPYAASIGDSEFSDALSLETDPLSRQQPEPLVLGVSDIDDPFVERQGGNTEANSQTEDPFQPQGRCISGLTYSQAFGLPSGQHQAQPHQQPYNPILSGSLGYADPFAASMTQSLFDGVVGVPHSVAGPSETEPSEFDWQAFYPPPGVDEDDVVPVVGEFSLGELPRPIPAIGVVPGRKAGKAGKFWKRLRTGIIYNAPPQYPLSAADLFWNYIEIFFFMGIRVAFMNADEPGFQMMYVSGETGEPSTETTGIIEDIVRAQVVELLRSCTDQATRRGSRAITINDLIFQIRDDAPKVSRLRTFLSWKDVRKNVKDSDDKGGEADIGGGEDPVGGGVVPGGPVEDAAKKNKKSKVGLPWEPSSFFNVEVPEREDEEDEEEEEMNYITLQRLRKADERTKAMTREEYVTWSEYRQASFTYRKGKRFREWAGFGHVTDSKPSDDIVDILGFLTFEMVQTLTEEALKIKDSEDQRKDMGEIAGTKKRKFGTLFNQPTESRTPVEPRHVQEAFRRLQQRSKKNRAMLNFTRQQQHTTLKLF